MGKFSRGQTGTQMPGAMSPTVAACILTADGASAPEPPHTRAVCQAPARGQVWTSYSLLARVWHFILTTAV